MLIARIALVALTLCAVAVSFTATSITFAQTAPSPPKSPPP